MNHEQKKYAMQRVCDVANQKKNDAKQKFQIEAETLTDSARVDLIYQGKVKLLSRDKIQDQYTDLADAFDFSKFEVKSGFKTGYDAIISLINKTAQDAKDQIMLGDCDEALKLIQKLDSIKV